MGIFDSHNHLQSHRFGVPAADMIAEMKAAGITGCVVNATCEEDWDSVRKLAGDFKGYVLAAYGIHPWFAHTVRPGWEERLQILLEDDSAASVGEIGVDGWVNFPEMATQKEVFLQQVEIAARTGRVMTVHCLKAWEELFQTMDEAELWPEKFLMHSYGGSIEIAARLLQKGAWFSFSGHFLHERKRKILEVFKQLPKDRILLETDAPEMIPPIDFVKFPNQEKVNHPANLEAIAMALEQELGGNLLDQIEKNGRFFWSRSIL